MQNIRNQKGQFVSTQQAMIADLQGFIADWMHWSKQALRSGDRAQAASCMAEVRDCRQKLNALQNAGSQAATFIGYTKCDDRMAVYHIPGGL